MMLPTHALAGMVLALPVALSVPEYAPVALLAGLVGGVFPDLDLYAGHRKTLHFPVYYAVLAAVAAPVALLAPSAASVGLAVALAAAAVHCAADAFGGGLELRPWEGTSSRAVYDHHRGRWVRPRRWVRYDGAPEDFLLALVLAAPLLATLSGGWRAVAAGALVAAAGYAVVRRRLPLLAELLVGWLAAVLPARALDPVPSRYLEPVADQRCTSERPDHADDR